MTVLALEDEHTTEDMSTWDPLKPLIAKRLGPTSIGYAPAITVALRHGEFDVLHQHGIWQVFSRQVSAWRRETGRPVMISPRGMLDGWAVQNSGWKKRLAGALYESRNLAGGTCFHALSLREAESIREFGLSNAVAIIPNGTDLPSANRSPPPRWWPEGKVLLFIGRIHPKKGLLELVHAFAKLRDVAPSIVSEWTLVIAGWDDHGHLARLQTEIAKLGLNGRVVLPGPIYGDEKDAALRHASAFVLPSHSEGLPMSVLEAWAYGRPVLMSDACNLPEGFNAGAAMQIRVEPTALSRDLSLFLAPDFSEQLADMGPRGLALVEARFSWRKIAEDHTAVYEWMIRGENEPSALWHG